jgi:phosphocarrier protein FPr
MVGIVIVSHSAKVADGAVELARQMADGVAIQAAGGIDAEPGIGTDAMKVAAAIEAVAQDGRDVLVLMDLGSAIMSAEVALQFVDPDVAARTHLCAAPVVEGAVAAAVSAGLGQSIEDVMREARAGLLGKQALLNESTPDSSGAADTAAGDGEWVTADLTITNAHGLHARPAAKFVQTAGAFDATVQVENVTTGAGPARASSLTDVATLGAHHGHVIRVRATGPQASAAVAALTDLAEHNFNESEDSTEESTPAAPQGRPMEMPFQLAADGSFQGMAAAPGVAIGPARRLRRPPAAPRVPGDPTVEAKALTDALARARSEVRFARESIAAQVGEEHAQMLDAHTTLLADDALIEPAMDAIASGTRAEDAWQAAIDAGAGRFAAMGDPYMRARAEDVRDIGRRVLAQFGGAASGPAVMRGPGILIARELGAGETASLDLSLVQGIAVATGSPTSHSAILARALGVPAVVNVGEVIMSISEDQDLLVDGDAGTVKIGPDAETVARVHAAQEAAAARAAAFAAAAHRPAVTTDGQKVEVAVNISGPDEVAAAVEAGADGVGLFRTEFLFTGRDAAPDEDEQEAIYRAVATGLDGGRLIIRTLDAGADKPVPYLHQANEDNPFLGTRGIRLSLAEPELFRTQLRAVLRVAADHRVALMFPMVATRHEILAARAQLEIARAELAERGVPAGAPQVGVMIEVPSAALCADMLATDVDFFSIGTNDLTQYTLAAERGNASVAGLADSAHPAVLRLIAIVCQAANRAGRWVGVCGELAADPELTPVLVGLGVRELSVAAPRVAEIKHAVGEISADDSSIMASEVLVLDSAGAIREALAGKCSGNCAGCANNCGGHDHDDHDHDHHHDHDHAY